MLLFMTIGEGEEKKCRFQLIYEKYRYFMWYLAEGILHDNVLAEEALYASFRTLCGKEEIINAINSMEDAARRNFLATLIRDSAFSMASKCDRKAGRGEAGGLTRHCDEREEDEDSLAWLEHTVSALKDESRVLLEYRYVHGLTDKQIAELKHSQPKNISDEIDSILMEFDVYRQKKRKVAYYDKDSSDKRMARVLRDYLSDEVDYMPSDYEIKQQHQLTFKLQQQMDQLIEDEETNEEKEDRRAFFKERVFTRRNIAIMLIVVTIASLMTVFRPWEYIAGYLRRQAGEMLAPEESREETTLEAEVIDERKEKNIEELEVIAEDTAVEKGVELIDGELSESTVWNYNSSSFEEGWIKFDICNELDENISYSPITKVEIRDEDGKFDVSYIAKDKSENSHLRAKEHIVERLEMSKYGIILPGEYRVSRYYAGKEITINVVLELKADTNVKEKR